MKEERIDIRNAEKYHDPTPFYAIKNIERSERLSRVTPGGVYRIRKNVGGTSFLGLVIARNEQVATVLNLYKEHQNPTDEVFDGYSTNLYMMGYAFIDTIEDLVFTVPESDMQRIRKSIQEKIGIIVSPEPEKVPVVEATEKPCSCPDHFRGITEKMDTYGGSFAALRRRYPTAVLIQLFDRLNRLDVLMQGGGGEAATKGEAIDDTLTDLASYAVMEMVERNAEKSS